VNAEFFSNVETLFVLESLILCLLRYTFCDLCVLTYSRSEIVFYGRGQESLQRSYVLG